MSANQYETQNTPENFRLFFRKVFFMRQNQKIYFRDRDKVSLSLAKQYEREVDALLEEFSRPPKAKQGELMEMTSEGKSDIHGL